MKTIKERARKYVLGAANGYNAEARISYFAEKAFIAGAQSEHEELTRWHDPKEVLPEPLKNVLVKCSDGTYIIDMFLPTFKMFDCEISLYVEVIGWREIHE
ncbi:MAG: hypothetical protein NC226_09595 [Bacteroides cellulosilyticus]|nr:hypothetical protein [Bacteroides cellulosilyticus]